MHFSKTVFSPHHKGSQEYEVQPYNSRQFPFPPHKLIWILPCSLSSSKMLPLKTSVIQSDSIPERQTKIQGDSSATCCLLLLIKMLELLVCIHYNLLVWHATQTISSCHQGSHFKWEDRSFLAFGKENRTKQNKKGMQKHLCYYFFQAGREKGTIIPS